MRDAVVRWAGTFRKSPAPLVSDRIYRRCAIFADAVQRSGLTPQPQFVPLRSGDIDVTTRPSPGRLIITTAGAKPPCRRASRYHASPWLAPDRVGMPASDDFCARKGYGECSTKRTDAVSELRPRKAGSTNCSSPQRSAVPRLPNLETTCTLDSRPSPSSYSVRRRHAVTLVSALRVERASGPRLPDSLRHVRSDGHGHAASRHRNQPRAQSIASSRP